MPWTVAEVFALAGCWTVGVACILAAWFATARTESLSSQVTWMSIAVVGVIVAGSGSGAWLLGGRRAVGVRRMRLAFDAALPSSAPVSVSALWDGSAGRVVVLGAPVTRHHDPDCLLVRGKDVGPARSSALEPCAVCEAARA